MASIDRYSRRFTPLRGSDAYVSFSGINYTPFETLLLREETRFPNGIANWYHEAGR